MGAICNKKAQATRIGKFECWGGMRFNFVTGLNVVNMRE